MNKDWERLVPAAAVIPAVQVAATIIGSKTSVACHVSLLLNQASQVSGCIRYCMARDREA